jgi:hypothetical protein
LHVAGQKNFNFLPVPGCILLHLFLGFIATYESHVLAFLPLNGTTPLRVVSVPSYTNESKFSHGPRNAVGDAVIVGVDVGDGVGESVFLHLILHVAGQKNFNFLPVPGCSFPHLLLGCIATYESHVLEVLPSNANESKFSHGPRNAVGDAVIVGDDVGDNVGDDVGEDVGGDVVGEVVVGFVFLDFFDAIVGDFIFLDFFDDFVVDFLLLSFSSFFFDDFSAFLLSFSFFRLRRLSPSKSTTEASLLSVEECGREVEECGARKRRLCCRCRCRCRYRCWYYIILYYIISYYIVLYRIVVCGKKERERER